MTHKGRKPKTKIKSEIGVRKSKTLVCWLNTDSSYRNKSKYKVRE
jgi:hypothetical protein